MTIAASVQYTPTAWGQVARMEAVTWVNKRVRSNAPSPITVTIR